MNKERLAKAKEFGRLISANLDVTRKLIRIDDLEPGELDEMIKIYQNYETDYKYKTGERFRYQGVLYEVIQGHTSQASWVPSESKALYKKVVPGNVIPNWEQPTHAETAYKIGDKVIYEGKVYKSLIVGNSTVPGTDKRYWELVE